MVDGRHLKNRKPGYFGNGMTDCREIWHILCEIWYT